MLTPEREGSRATLRRPWGCSSAGRAPRSHRGGQGFESPHLHHPIGGIPTSVVAAILVALVALIHAYIVVLEMVLWKTPRGRQAFGTSVEEAETMATLAANQGLYNGFLAAGLALSLVLSEPVALAFKLFFLVCVIVAGLYGAATVSRRILVVQAAPAALALIAVLLAR
jgi:putative membrane protein